VKIKTIATAALVPAALAGGVAVALTGGSPAGATAGHSAHARTLSDAQADARAKTAKPKAHSPAGNVNNWVTVKPGQTLAAIGAAHHMTWQAIYATAPNAQHIPNPDRLAVGEHLRIPADPTLRAAQFRSRYAATLRREAAARRAAAQQAASQAQASQQQPASQPQPAAATAGGSGGSLTAGMSSFEQCVAYRESTDTPTDPDGLFGILPSTWAELGYSGTAGQASVAQQEVAFNRLYAEYGAQPWAPSDGC
jgi:LysM domain